MTRHNVDEQSISPLPIAEAAATLAASAHQLLAAVNAHETFQISSSNGDGTCDPQLLPALVYRIRRARDDAIQDLPERSWDILLDLYHNQLLGRRVSITSACIASAGPSTTALRHILTLVEDDLIARRQCAHDARKVYIELTSLGLSRMEEWIARSHALIREWQTGQSRQRWRR